MSKRFQQNFGITLIVSAALAGLVIELWLGNIVSTHPPEIIGHESSATGSYTAVFVQFSFHWAVLLPLLAMFTVGLTCLLISARRLR